MIVTRYKAAIMTILHKQMKTHLKLIEKQTISVDNKNCKNYRNIET